MKFAIVTGGSRSDAESFTARLETVIEASDASVVNDEPADLVLAVGGDGTMLGAVQLAVEWDAPVLGFNLGTLGFLTEADPELLDETVARLIANDFQIDRRMTLEASTSAASAVGINDLVVEKVDSTRLISLALEINGEAFTNYSADGLIVATPTGSTGYAFSAGGPIVDTSLDALILTPVATHSLFDRPLVLAPDDVIEIKVIRDRPVRVYVDKTDLGHLGEGDSVTVSRGDREAKFVTFGDSSYIGRVRDKFGLDH